MGLFFYSPIKYCCPDDDALYENLVMDEDGLNISEDIQPEYSNLLKKSILWEKSKVLKKQTIIT